MDIYFPNEFGKYSIPVKEHRQNFESDYDEYKASKNETFTNIKSELSCIKLHDFDDDDNWGESLSLVNILFGGVGGHNDDPPSKTPSISILIKFSSNSTVIFSAGIKINVYKNKEPEYEINLKDNNILGHDVGEINEYIKNIPALRDLCYNISELVCSRIIDEYGSILYIIDKNKSLLENLNKNVRETLDQIHIQPRKGCDKSIQDNTETEMNKNDINKTSNELSQKVIQKMISSMSFDELMETYGGNMITLDELSSIILNHSVDNIINLGYIDSLKHRVCSVWGYDINSNHKEFKVYFSE